MSKEKWKNRFLVLSFLLLFISLLPIFLASFLVLFKPYAPVDSWWFYPQLLVVVIWGFSVELAFDGSEIRSMRMFGLIGALGIPLWVWSVYN
jgi:hypothetical protein